MSKPLFKVSGRHFGLLNLLEHIQTLSLRLMKKKLNENCNHNYDLDFKTWKWRWGAQKIRAISYIDVEIFRLEYRWVSNFINFFCSYFKTSNAKLTSFMLKVWD